MRGSKGDVDEWHKGEMEHWAVRKKVEVAVRQNAVINIKVAGQLSKGSTLGDSQLHHSECCNST